MRTIHVVSAAALLALSLASPARAQRPESLDTTPNWPNRYRAGTIVPGEVVAVDGEGGTARVETPGGEITVGLGRLFSYHDTHLHRIGTNYEQLPVNRPRSEVHTYNKDGAMRYAHSGNQPVHAPNSHGGPQADPARYADPGWFVEAGEIVRSASELHAEDDDFIQAGNLYRDVMSATNRDHLVSNIVGHIADGVERQVQERAVALWRQVDPDLAAHIAQGLGLVIRACAPVEANVRR